MQTDKNEALSTTHLERENRANVINAKRKWPDSGGWKREILIIKRTAIMKMGYKGRAYAEVFLKAPVAKVSQ